ncbi:MAG: hypothetical protein CMG63_03430 [Candidatus Marinimicrobia bacterium]|nr:hypothetical protein [Candidatus Neomarinimicrobiota bacterium]
MEKRFMRYFIFSIIFVFLLDSSIYAQFGKREKTLQSKVNKFSLSSFSHASNIDSLEVVIFLEIPYSILQFVKKKNHYSAYYQASIFAKDINGMQISQSVWRDSIVVVDYLNTKSWTLNRKHFSSFNVSKIGEFEIFGELQDLDTRKKGVKREELKYQFEDNTSALVSSIFLLDLEGEWGFKNGKIPTHGKVVKELGQGVELNITGFVKSSPYDIEVLLTNGTVNDSLIFDSTYQKSEGFFNEYLFIKSIKLNALKNDFSIFLRQDKKTFQKNISFSKFKTGISSYITNIDLALKQMKYIIDDNHQGKSKRRLKKDKENHFYALWKKMDPTPNTEHNELMEEYYRRVSYSNENFDGWKDGWETDRGMIYILFGPPDKVDRTNPSMANSTLYQVWSYYKINKQFVFKDQNGFGDFRLESPMNGFGLR